jgi:methionyl aminopeptidase
MAIPIKTPGEIATMRSSGRLAWSVVQEVARASRAGVTSRELDDAARQAIARTGVQPLLLGYKSADGVEFPGTACICINEEVVHAVPSDRIVRDGDVVTVDIAIRGPESWCADAATTVAIGQGQRGTALAAAAKSALAAAMELAGPGVLWSDIASHAAAAAAKAGCSLVPGYCGHGIGRAMHEAPRLCFGAKAGTQDVRLEPGMVITIEPIVVEGDSAAVLTLDDGWTVVTANRAWAGHEERTIAVTRRGWEVLTASATGPATGP